MKLVTAGLLCVMGIAGLGGAALAQTAPNGPVDPEARFRRLDRDGDGRLSREEFPQQAQRLFERLDADRDGYVTLQEDRAARQARTGAQQQAQQGGAARPPLPTPDFADVSYGPHERNVLDLWQAESEEPTPLVIFFHGGGFRSGDKRNLQPRLLQELLRNGISVAAANYRLTDTAPYPAQMQDAARAVQFLRHRSREYNVDSERFAATGGSAGAGISQWMLFHDDLADADSEDPVARESTRLTCAVATAAQSSYDPRYMMELFGSTEVESAMWAFYGMDSREDLRDPKFQRLFEEASPINHATADDPPLMLIYPQANDPLPPNPPGRLFIHHPKFGIAMKEKLDELGVECVLKLREDYPGRTFGIGQLNDTVAFFIRHLQPGGRMEPLRAALPVWHPQGPAQEAGSVDKAAATSAYHPEGEYLRAATQDLTWMDAARNREVPVRVFAPDLDQGRGPFPVVVFSHGGGESREAFDYLGTHWAQHGYVAVFLTHLGSDRAVVAEQGMRALAVGAEHFRLRPEDVRFVLDKLLSEDPGCELLAGRVAKDQIAAAGQCAGATTALAMVGLVADLPNARHATFQDPRFTCAIALSPQPGGRRGSPLHADSWAGIEVPTLMVTGTRDFSWFPESRANPNRTRVPFDGLPPGDKYLVEIKDAEHNAFTDSVPYYPARQRDPRHHRWIQRATTAFLDAYLKEDAGKLAWLRAEALEAETKGECLQEQKPAGASQTATRGPTPAAVADNAPPQAPDQDRTERMLDLFDRDGDQALSKDEAPRRLKNVFDRVDRNGDGSLTREELHPLLDRAGQGPAPQRAPEPALQRPPDPDATALPTAAVYPVAVIDDLVLHDGTREKDLTLRITYPQAAGPFPVILLVHAVRRRRTDFEPLARRWAANGYVVCQADHADTGRMGADWRDRARDMSFVIDSLDNMGRQAPELATRMDASRIGAAGHLIGAYAAFAVAGMKGKTFGPRNDGADFTDPRVDAVLLLSPHGRGQELDETSWDEVRMPMLVVAGSRMPSRRTSNPPEWRTEAFRFAKSDDAYLLWVEGMDSGYAGLCIGEDIDPTPAGCVEEVTTAFWDAHLKDDSQARTRLRDWPIPEDETGCYSLECRQAQTDANPQSRPPIAEPVVANRYDFSPLDRFLEESVGRVGGGCAFILIQGDRVIHRNAYGTFPPEKVVPVASSSKWVSGGVLMTLVDAGEISLDDPVSKYLPYFEGKKAKITIRQLFTHTSGLTGNAREHLYNTSLTMDQAARAIAECELVADPGTALYYGGLGMQVAGRICEVVAGKPWMHLFGEALRQPLEMAHTDYYARGPTENPNVAGSLRTCVDDYGNYLIMLLHGGVYKGRRVLSEEAVATMLSNQSGSLPVLRHAYDSLDVIDPKLAIAPYGIGCWLEDYDPESARTTEISSGGGFGCMPFLDLKRNIAGVFLPYCRNWRLDSKGRRYNDAHRVYYEAKAIMNEILDAGAHPQAVGTPRKPISAVDRLGPSTAAARGTTEVHGDPAAGYSARHGGRAVLVMVHGETVFERYDNGFDAATPTHLHSATKGFWGPVIAAMIEDGLVDSFDEPATKTLPEWRDDPRKSRITLRHLLNLSAGLVQDVANLQGHDRPTLAPDLYRHAIGVRAAREPGSVFQYGPSCYYVLGEIMKRKLAGRGQTPLDYLKQRILDPIGVEVGPWVHDASGNPHIPNGAHLTARNWAKFGQWLLQGGEWDGEQIVRRDLLEELVRPSRANPGHGMALWLNQPGGHGAFRFHSAPPGAVAGFIHHDGLPEMFAALGAGKCRMYIIPSLEMVALRQGDTEGDGFDDNTFLSLLLTGRTTESPSRRRGLPVWRLPGTAGDRQPSRSEQ